MGFPFYIPFIALSFLAGLLSLLTKTYPAYLKLFPWFLLLSLVIEIAGSMMSDRSIPNALLYNLFTIIEFVFYLSVLKGMLVRQDAKRILHIVTIIYFLISLVNLFFIQGLHNFNSITYSLGCLLIVAGAIYYFFELFQVKKFINLLKEPSFWVCSGLLFYYCCSFPLISMVNFFHEIPDVIIQNLSFVLSMLNVLLYLLYTIAFLCRFRTPKYMS